MARKKKYVGYGKWSKGTIINKSHYISGVKCMLVKQ